MTKGYRRILIDGICLGFHIDGFNNHLLEWNGKGSWLIAGYNTMDDKEKQNRGRCEMAF